MPLINFEREKNFVTFRNWIILNENSNKNEHGPGLKTGPVFSFVMTVLNDNPEYLRESVDSVLAQTYDDYELIIVAGCSAKEYESNPHVKIISGFENGNVSEMMKAGISVAKGDYLGFVECGDTIAHNACLEFARKLIDNPELDFIYSDGDRLTEDGKLRHMPYFKPDWSPDLFWCDDYTDRSSVYKMSIAKKLGEFHSDYDFTFRFMEESDNRRVGHISKILYHRRDREESCSSETEKHIKEDALRRRNISGHLEYINDVGRYRVAYEIKDHPLVSIIIPSKDNPKILKQCIESVIKCTNYDNIEVIVIDNGSREENRKEIEKYLGERGYSYLYDSYEFNFSYMCNLGAKASKGEFLLFLNDDVEAFDEKWLERMLGMAQQEHAGAVGAKLYYPNTAIIQHAGVSNLKEGPGHVLLRQYDNVTYYFGLNRLDSDFLAVTAACMMVSRAKFLEAGMFDETLPVSYNDMDLCFRLYELGYYNVVRQDAVLYHHESFSRGVDDIDSDKGFRLSGEKLKLYLKHPNLKGRDPFLNENIHNHCGFELDLRIVAEKPDPYEVPESVPFQTASIDSVVCDTGISITGWAFLEGKENGPDMERYLIFRDGYGDCFRSKIYPYAREDVVNAFGGRKDIRFSGFKWNLDHDDLRLDVVPNEIGIQIIDKEGCSYIYWDEKRGFFTCNDRTGKIYNDFTLVGDYELYDINNPLLKAGIDQVIKSSEGVEIRGWAFVSGEKLNSYKTSLVLRNDAGEALEMDVTADERPDVGAAYCEEEFINGTGFKCFIHPDIADRYSKSELIVRVKHKYQPERVFDAVSNHRL